MVKKGKGSFGNLKKQSVKQGLIALGMLAICAAIFLSGFFWLKKYATILTVIAVLGLIPTAKCIVSMIIYMRSEKYCCPNALHEKILSLSGSAGDDLLCGFDFYLTSYEKNFPLYVSLVKKGTLIACSSMETSDCNKAEEHIETYMKKNGISGIHVKVFSDENRFLERFEQLVNETEKATEQEKALFQLLKNLSI